MPSSGFSTDYLSLVLTISSTEPVVVKMVNLLNEFPEGSARRFEMEAVFLDLLADHARSLAELVREQNKVTLYDED